ncbi:MAG: hypothetical protein QOG04_172 [Actinomycetota bacterium]|jgi:hypothetical protein|nr:hypothetical protein [Actinomycetota bacterium]
MPDIDTDLFQVLALGLLFFCLLALLAALNALNKIAKQLSSGTPAAGGGQAAPQPATSYEYTPPATSYEPAPTYTAPQTTTPAPEVSTGFVSMSDAATAAPASSAPAASSGLRGDEPEEQPFERDGRWWFKRGGELLVYDEGTGQWVASPSSAAGSAAAAPATTGVVERADAGEGWKCSSCGAVNGSTATSCRMCFAPR